MNALFGAPATWAASRRGLPEMTKYNARRTTVDGIHFDSQAEAMRYCQLKLLQEAKQISGLFCHIRFCLQDAFKRDGKTILGIWYEADFLYNENGRRVVEDVKGKRTAVYLLKRKIFWKAYPDIDFREIDA